MNRALYMALLSMAPYNRGYGASLIVDGSKIGEADLRNSAAFGITTEVISS